MIGQRYAQAEEVEFAGPRNGLCKEQDGQHGDDHADQMPFSSSGSWICSQRGNGKVSSTNSAYRPTDVM